ncbi:MAG TPA: hypothetical protein VGM87_04235 [Roseomonas sp.]|jgi:hypothetical protein
MIRLSLAAAAAALLIAGGAHAQGITANTGVTVQNTSISAGGTANGDVRYGGSFRQDQNVPAPNQSTFTTNPCTLPQGVAAGFLGVSAGVQVTFLDEGCDARADAAAWRGLGYPQVGIARMRQRDANARAWAEAMGGQAVAPVPMPPVSAVPMTDRNTTFVPVPVSGATTVAAGANAAIAAAPPVATQVAATAPAARTAAAPAIYSGNCWDRAQRLVPTQRGCQRL